MKSLASALDDPLRVNAFLITLAFTSVFVLPGQSAATYPTYLLLLAVLLSFERWKSVMLAPVAWLSAALLTYLALSCLWSEPNPDRDAFKIGSRALLTFAFVIAFAECREQPVVQKWFNKSLVSGAMLAMLAASVVHILLNPPDGRLNGLGQLGTHVIAALLFGVALLHAMQIFLLDNSAGWRRFAALGAVLLVIAIVASGSRNAWVSVSCGVAVFVCANHFTRRRQFVAALLVLAGSAIAVLGVLFLSEGTRDFLLPRGDSFRLFIWSSLVADVWRDNIVFGRGVLTADHVINGPDIYPHPHNMYLATLYQGGLIGLGLFLALLAVVIRSLFARYECHDAKLALAILAIALPSYVLDGHELVDRIGETWFLFWLPVGICLALLWRTRLPDSVTPAAPEI